MKKILGISATIAFILIFILIWQNKISFIDENVINTILQIRSQGLTNFFSIVTNLGGKEFILILTIILFIIFRGKEEAFFIVANILIILSFNLLFKQSIQRPRPPIENRLIEESGYSFPSGHSMCATAYYGYLIYLVSKKIKNKKAVFSLTFLMSGIIILIMTSRVYLGVHYASDVLAGCLFSVVYLTIFTEVTESLKKI